MTESTATAADQEWLTDANGNKCSVTYFGSREAAQRALSSLKRCANCTNCSDCSGCSDCSYCSGCSDCSDCSGCSYCSYCSDCSGCSDISRRRRVKGLNETSNQPTIPVVPDIHQRVLAAVTARPDALDMSTWHTCDTTHCRAGWVVQLAGEAGKALESFHNTPLAAALIYRESSPIRVPMRRFYETDEEAMADIKRMAEMEAETAGAASAP